MGKTPVHRLVADTDALLALGSSECWSLISDNIGISTTSTCRSELYEHKRRGNTKYDFQASARRARLSNSAEKVVEALSDNSSTISCHHFSNCRNGEHSIAKLVSSNLDVIEGILMMDAGNEDDLDLGGRDLVKAHVDLDKNNINFSSPVFPIAVLYIEEIVPKDLFCLETKKIIRQEDWTSYSAIKRMWEEIPVDCGGYIPSKYMYP